MAWLHQRWQQQLCAPEMPDVLLRAPALAAWWQHQLEMHLKQMRLPACPPAPADAACAGMSKPERSSPACKGTACLVLSGSLA